MTEHQLVNYYNLEIGDRLIRNKGIVSTHHGIYVGIHSGTPLVAENQVAYGVRYVSLAEFLLKNIANLREIRRFNRSEYYRDQVMADANSLLGMPYNLIHFNCEHFADLLQNGRANSKQVDNAMAGAGLVAILGIMALLFGAGK
jgi:hypothetical protein